METKACSDCGVVFPATSQYFKTHKNNKTGLTSLCKMCAQRRLKQWRDDNPELVKAQKKRWRERYKAAHPDYMKELSAIRRSANPDHNREQVRLWKIKNPEKYREQKKRWLALHPDVEKIKKERRRSLKLQLPSTLTSEQWAEIKDRFNNCCAYCGEHKPLTQDHLVPISKGGPYTADNIIPACATCNSSKGAKEFEQWYPRQAFYDSERERLVVSL